MARKRRTDEPTGRANERVKIDAPFIDAMRALLATPPDAETDEAQETGPHDEDQSRD